MNKEINHDQISSVDQIDQFKWTVRVIEGGKFGQSFKKTFKRLELELNQNSWTKTLEFSSAGGFWN